MASPTTSNESTPLHIDLASPLYLADAASTPYAEPGQSEDSPTVLPFSRHDGKSVNLHTSPALERPPSVPLGPYDLEGNLLSPSTFHGSALYTRVPLASPMPLHHPTPHLASGTSLHPLLGFHPRVLTYSPPKNYALVVRDLELEHICAFLGRFGLEVPDDSGE